MSRASRHILALCALALAPLSACETGRPGVTNTLGVISVRLDADPEHVTRAARETLEELALSDVEAHSTHLDGLVRGRTALGDAVKIEIEGVPGGASEVSIRCGTLGDEELSLQILDAIRARL